MEHIVVSTPVDPETARVVCDSAFFASRRDVILANKPLAEAVARSALASALDGVVADMRALVLDDWGTC